MKTPLGRHLLHLPLGGIFNLFLLLVALLLGAAALLGGRQYLLYRHCNEVVARGEGLVFRFSGLREQINQALLIGADLDFDNAVRDVQAIKTDVAAIVDDVLVPEKLRLAFIDEADLIGLLVLLREVRDLKDVPGPEELRRLTGSLGAIGARLQRFHELLSAHVDTLLLGLHRALAGLLALIVTVVSTIFLLVNRYVAEPVLRLCERLEPESAATGQDGVVVNSVGRLIETVEESAAIRTRLDLLLGLAPHLGALADTVENLGALYEPLCGLLHANADYSLVWIALPGDEAGAPQAGAMVGCVRAAAPGCAVALNELLSYCRRDGGLCDVTRKTLTGGEASVGLVRLPVRQEGPAAALPLIAGDCMVAALPLLVGGELKAVVSLYRQPPRGFDHREMTLLGLLLTALSEALERRFSPEPARLDNESTLYRLAALGVLTGGIAHEITNFSNGAGNYGQALLDLAREEGLGEDGLVLLENLMTEEHKVAALSGDLARLAQPGDGQATLNVPDIFSRLREVLRGRLRADAIDLRGEAPSGLPELPADATMLLLLLLVENAIQGLNAAPTANKAITLNAALGGEGVLFTVRDNGPQRSEAMLAALHFPPARLESLAQCLGYAISTERQADRGNAWHLAVPRAAKRDD